MNEAQPIYQETDSWPALSWAVLLGASAALLYAALGGEVAGPPSGWDLEHDLLSPSPDRDRLVDAIRVADQGEVVRLLGDPMRNAVDDDMGR